MIKWDHFLLKTFYFFHHVGVRINSSLSTSIFVCRGREGKKHLYLATKFILYTEKGSIFLLLRVLGIALYGSNEPILNFETLANQLYPVALEIILYIGFYYYFCCQINNYPITYMVTKQPWRSTL